MKTFIFSFIFFFTLFFSGAAQEKEWSSVMLAKSDFSYKETRNRLLSALENNPAIEVFAEIDHAKNAWDSGMELGPTQVFLFGNAEVGTPVMQKNQLAGLDLPLKISIWEDKTGNVFLGYTDVNFLKTRHRLSPRKGLKEIKKNLKALTKKVTGSTPEKTGKFKVKYREGIEIFQSSNSYQKTLLRLKNAIEEQQLTAQIDHARNAEKKGLGMRPTFLVIFGNPEIGTKLMQNNITTALVLPLKILVWRDENGEVKLAWNNPEFLMERFSINGNREEIEKMKKVLNNLTKEATGNPSK